MDQIPQDVRQHCHDLNPFFDDDELLTGPRRISPATWLQYREAAEAVGLRPLMDRRHSFAELRAYLDDRLLSMHPTTLAGCVALMEVLFLADLATSGDTWRAVAEYPDSRRFLSLAQTARHMAGGAG